MIDGLLAAKAERTNYGAVKDLKPSQSIVKRRFISPPNASKLTLISPPWHGADKVSSVLENRAVRSGSAVLSYYFHDSILSADKEGVPKNYDYIEHDIVEQVNGLRAEYGFSEVHLIGKSLGCVALARASRGIDHITQVTVVVPGSDLAQSLWHGRRTRHLRQEFEEQGVSLPELATAWRDLAPKEHATELAGVPVRVILSRNDEFIPSEYGEEYVEAIRDAGADVRVESSRMGHVANLLKYALTPGEL